MLTDSKAASSSAKQFYLGAYKNILMATKHWAFLYETLLKKHKAEDTVTSQI